MRIFSIIIVFLLLSSCEDKSKWSNSEYKKYKILSNSSYSLVFFYDQNDVLIKCRNLLEGGGYQEFMFDNGDVNFVESISYVNSSFFKIAEVIFNERSNDKTLTYFEEFSRESFKEINIGDTVKIMVYNYFDEPIQKGIITAQFDVIREDTVNSFYYKKEANKFTIITDFHEFIPDSNFMDSIVIKYTGMNDSINFINPEKELVLPNLKPFNPVSIYNNLEIESRENVIVGTLWGFPKNKEYGYSYKLLYLEGDLLSRMTLKRKRIESILSFNHSTPSNQALVSSLISTKLFRLKKGVLIETPRLDSLLGNL